MKAGKRELLSIQGSVLQGEQAIVEEPKHGFSTTGRLTKADGALRGKTGYADMTQCT